MIVLTGGGGFIGSNVLAELNAMKMEKIIVVDSLNDAVKWRNLVDKRFVDYWDKDKFLKEFSGWDEIEAVVHMGARTDTMDFDVQAILEDNYYYSQKLWQQCAARGIRFIYASSASVYGAGANGFSEASDVRSVIPLNPYAWSKHLFDRWITMQEADSLTWAGLRFFNVYGPGEWHKGRMASVMLHFYNQIMETGSCKLFRSYQPEYPDGGQLRDFVYVKDVASLIAWLVNHDFASGYYNVGTGTPRSFLDVAEILFARLGMPPKIEFIDMPKGLSSRYQYFTSADMYRTNSLGSGVTFRNIESGVSDYVNELRLTQRE